MQYLATVPDQARATSDCYLATLFFQVIFIFFKKNRNPLKKSYQTSANKYIFPLFLCAKLRGKGARATACTGFRLPRVKTHQPVCAHGTRHARVD